MVQSCGKRVRRLALAAAMILCVAVGTCAYVLPGQVGKLFQEPRNIPALAVACWRFETLTALTVRQRLLYHYFLTLDRDGTNLSVVFHPRQPNVLTEESAEIPRRAWETHVLVNLRTFEVVR
jgi:hypothetical protein